MFSTILENIINSIESIRANKLRASLSMLWIIIWVCSVIILTAIWNWSQQTILEKIDEMWTNVLTISSWGWFWKVWGKSTSSNSLTQKVVDAIKEVDWIKSVLPVISTNWQLVYWSNNMSATVYWVSKDYLTARNIELDYGSNITTTNIKNLEKVAVVGQDIVSELFDGENPVWKNIKMWNNVFRITWVLKENSTYDSYVFIPLSTAWIRITGQKYYSQIIVLVSDSEKIDTNEEDINNKLIEVLEVTDTDNLPYRIRNNSEMLESMSSITWTLTMLLSWIAWISLLVWWIWVMNIMLVSVTERTKEIWIRKAIWAWKSDILLQFLTEASSISVIWWLIWIAISYAVVYGLTKFSISAVISTNSIILSFWFSLMIWVVFGLLPAYKAAKLRPIDALRFE